MTLGRGRAGEDGLGDPLALATSFEGGEQRTAADFCGLC